MALDGLDAPVRLCIALPEGVGDLDSPGTIPIGLIDALAVALGPGVPVCGGLAADQTRFTGTYQFCNGQVYTDALPILLVAGPVHVATGIASGWEPVGEEHRLTNVGGLVIGGIDGMQPACAAVQRGELVATAINPTGRIHGGAVWIGYFLATRGDGESVPKYACVNGAALGARKAARASALAWCRRATTSSTRSVVASCKSGRTSRGAGASRGNVPVASISRSSTCRETNASDRGLRSAMLGPPRAAVAPSS